MIRVYLVTLICVFLSACAAPRSTTNDLEVGMSKAEVKAILGEPDSSAAIEGRGECSYYSMWRDFWNRHPGDYSDRYFVCFKNRKVVSYGRVGDPI